MAIGGKKLTVLIGLAAAAIAVVYVLIDAWPSDYAPLALSEDQKQQAAASFVNACAQFSNGAQATEPYTLALGEEQVNSYFASADEIADTVGQPLKLRRLLETAGLADPAVALHDGHMRLMVRSLAKDKVVGADLRFVFQPDGRLRVEVAGASVGRLPLPRSAIQPYLEQLATPRSPSSARDPKDIAEAAMAIVTAAAKGEAMPTETDQTLNRRPVRLTGVTLTEGRMTLHLQPIRRKAALTPGG